jgi:hypothetical protein
MDRATLEKISTIIDTLSAETALYIATYEMRLEALEQKYSPNQPRVPAGSPDGGQWTDGGGGGGGGGSSSFERRLPNDLLKPGRDAIDEVYPEAVLPVWRGTRAAIAVGRARVAAASSTAHGAVRLGQRGISHRQAKEAIRTAKKLGNVTTKIGKYGTAQHVYRGGNGVTAIVETAGRNAGKIITVYKH